MWMRRTQPRNVVRRHDVLLPQPNYGKSIPLPDLDPSFQELNAAIEATRNAIASEAEALRHALARYCLLLEKPILLSDVHTEAYSHDDHSQPGNTTEAMALPSVAGRLLWVGADGPWTKEYPVPRIAFLLGALRSDSQAVRIFYSTPTTTVRLIFHYAWDYGNGRTTVREGDQDLLNDYETRPDCLTFGR